MTELRRNEQLAKCEPVSFLGTVIQASQLGLELGTVLGHAYPVPFWNNKLGYLEATLIVGYRGFMELARRSGLVQKIDARVVYMNDRFEVEYGFDEKLVHVPVIDGDRGPMRCTYAVALLDGGARQFEIVSLADIKKVKEDSLSKIKNEAAKKYSPWVAYEDEMARKTAVRRLFKYLPISIERHENLAMAMEQDNKAHEGIFDRTLDIDPIPPMTESQADLKVMKDDEVSMLIEVAKNAFKSCKDPMKQARVMKKYNVSCLEDLAAQESAQLSAIIADLRSQE